MGSASGRDVACGSGVDVRSHCQHTARRVTQMGKTTKCRIFLFIPQFFRLQMRDSFYRGERGGMASYDFAPRVCSRAYNCARGILIFFPHPFSDIFFQIYFYYSSSGIFLLFPDDAPGGCAGRFVRVTRVMRPGASSIRVMRPSVSRVSSTLKDRRVYQERERT